MSKKRRASIIIHASERVCGGVVLMEIYDLIDEADLKNKTILLHTYAYLLDSFKRL
jgi:hypothetical protein